MPDFSHLKKYEIESTKTVECPLDEIEGRPVLLVVPAMESNKPFFNAMLRRARKSSKAMQAGVVTANIINDNRDEDRELYAQYIVKGWNGVKDASGNDVPFEYQNCLEYLKALPNRIFDDVRSFCSKAINFTEQGLQDAEGTSKN